MREVLRFEFLRHQNQEKAYILIKFPTTEGGCGGARVGLHQYGRFRHNGWRRCPQAMI